MTLHLIPHTSAEIISLDGRTETTFHPAARTVEMRTVRDGSVFLTMEMAEAHLAMYAREAAVAEAQAKYYRKQFNALEDARCLVVDRNGGWPPRDAA